MFDCNRLFHKGIDPGREKISEKKLPVKRSLVFTYSTYPGRTTRALDSCETYLKHLRKQTKGGYLILP